MIPEYATNFIKCETLTTSAKMHGGAGLASCCNLQMCVSHRRAVSTGAAPVTSWTPPRWRCWPPSQPHMPLLGWVITVRCRTVCHYCGTIVALLWHYCGTIMVLLWHYCGTIVALLWHYRRNTTLNSQQMCINISHIYKMNIIVVTSSLLRTLTI